MGAKRPRARAELIQLLADQRAALAASCGGYDQGNEWEAARLATTMFNLFHDGGAIKSLLTQLGLRAGLRFVSTGEFPAPPNMIVKFTTPPLIGFRSTPGGGMRFVPQFSLEVAKPEPKRVQFAKWWAEESIFHEPMRAKAAELTRRRLVFALRHQDGGGHVGELTDPAYVRLKAGAGVSGSAPDGTTRPLIEAANATMRQIAWEVTETLKDLGEVA